MFALVALAMLLGTALIMSQCGLKDSSLLVMILTGAVAIGQQIAGIKPANPPPPPGTSTTFVQTPADPNAPKV